jgi:RNA polymerase sigma-70 factor (TIGR02960 family)
VPTSRSTVYTRGVQSDDLGRARAGDASAFRELVAPYRAELRVHCYRMLGSLQDAEDALQETLTAAWQGMGSFEGRASMRSWLYKIATNRCLNERRTRSRRPTRAYDVPGVSPPEPSGWGEISWLEPFPTVLIEEMLESRGQPDLRYQEVESVSLTFVTALQSLPRRSLAALVLTDILGFRADEAASMLGTTVSGVNSALRRAREKMKRLPADRGSASAAAEASERVVRDFAVAWEAGDVDAVVALLTDDVFISMPPFPNEYRGRSLAARFIASIFDAGRKFVLVPTSANRQPGFGAYLRSNQGAPEGPEPTKGVGLYVLEVSGERISALTRFEEHLLPWFGLPAQLRVK